MWFRRRSQGKSGQEAQAALDDATDNLLEVRKRWPEVTQLATAFREIRERNHFVEQLGAIIARNGGSTR